MAVATELERVSDILDKATLNQQVSGRLGQPTRVASFKGGSILYGLFPYQRRAVGVPGRALTFELTRQPVLAVEHGGRIISLPYAEDVIQHPLGDRLESALVVLSQVQGGNVEQRA